MIETLDSKSLIFPVPVFVYGTLRSGERNHVLLEDSEKVMDGYVEGFVRSDDDGLPFVVPFAALQMFGRNGNDLLPGWVFKLEDLLSRPKWVNGEVYRVDRATLRELDKLEHHPVWYYRIPVTVKSDSRILRREIIAFMYAMHTFQL